MRQKKSRVQVVFGLRLKETRMQRAKVWIIRAPLPAPLPLESLPPLPYAEVLSYHHEIDILILSITLRFTAVITISHLRARSLSVLCQPACSLLPRHCKLLLQSTLLLMRNDRLAKHPTPTRCRKVVARWTILFSGIPVVGHEGHCDSDG